MTPCNASLPLIQVDAMNAVSNIQRFAASLVFCVGLMSLTKAAETSSFVASDSIATYESNVLIETSLVQNDGSDRLWLINTRHLTSDACRANLDSLPLKICRLYCDGQTRASDSDQYLTTLQMDRPVVIYVHGNRMDPGDAIQRGLLIYRETTRYRCNAGPIDWVIWSWPSEKEGGIVNDVREKADRTDAQGLYLAGLLRQHTERSIPTSLIGYSFGGRVITGALHALAGGSLARRTLPSDPVSGAPFDVGLVAPAIENDWMGINGYHGLATQNMDRLVLLYNHRDAVLKRYWIIDRIRGEVALGYSGPKTFAPRIDGTPLPVRSRDCSPAVGIKHDEEDYYSRTCGAGRELGPLVVGALERSP